MKKKQLISAVPVKQTLSQEGPSRPRYNSVPVYLRNDIRIEFEAFYETHPQFESKSRVMERALESK